MIASSFLRPFSSCSRSSHSPGLPNYRLRKSKNKAMSDTGVTDNGLYFQPHPKHGDKKILVLLLSAIELGQPLLLVPICFTCCALPIKVQAAFNETVYRSYGRKSYWDLALRWWFLLRFFIVAFLQTRKKHLSSRVFSPFQWLK